MVCAALTCCLVIDNICRLLSCRYCGQALGDLHCACQVGFAFGVGCVVQLVGQCVQCFVDSILIRRIYAGVVRQQGDLAAVCCLAYGEVTAVYLGRITAVVLINYGCVAAVAADAYASCAVHVHYAAGTCEACQPACACVVPGAAVQAQAEALACAGSRPGAAIGQRCTAACTRAACPSAVGRRQAQACTAAISCPGAVGQVYGCVATAVRAAPRGFIRADGYAVGCVGLAPACAVSQCYAAARATVVPVPGGSIQRDSAARAAAVSCPDCAISQHRVQLAAVGTIPRTLAHAHGRAAVVVACPGRTLCEGQLGAGVGIRSYVALQLADALGYYLGTAAAYAHTLANAGIAAVNRYVSVCAVSTYCAVNSCVACGGYAYCAACACCTHITCDVAALGINRSVSLVAVGRQVAADGRHACSRYAYCAVCACCAHIACDVAALGINGSIGLFAVGRQITADGRHACGRYAYCAVCALGLDVAVQIGGGSVHYYLAVSSVDSIRTLQRQAACVLHGQRAACGGNGITACGGDRHIMLVQLQRRVLGCGYGAACCRDRSRILGEFVDVVGIRQYACISIFLIRRIIAGKLCSESSFTLSRRPILAIINAALVQGALAGNAVILNIADKFADRGRCQPLSNFSVTGQILFTVLIACIIQLVGHCIQCIVNNVLISKIYPATISQKRDAGAAGRSADGNITAINLSHVISSMSHNYRCIAVVILDAQIAGCAVRHIDGRTATCCGCQ